MKPIMRMLLAALTLGSLSARSQQYPFSGSYGQVEVGGPFVGAEFHGSQPLPCKISFYSPVTNCIDLSTGYWERRESRPVVVGIRMDDGERRWLGKEPWASVISPHRVVFLREAGGFSCSMTYEFSGTEPVMVYRLSLRNSGRQSRRIEIYSHIRLALRTSHTYTRVDSAFASGDIRSVTASFRGRETGGAAITVQNCGALPSAWTADGRGLSVSDSGTSRWISSPSVFDSVSGGGMGLNPVAVAAFLYRTTVHPGDSLVVIQLISSVGEQERETLVPRLPLVWKHGVAAYDSTVRRAAFRAAITRTGLPDVDRSAAWARGILATNAHYIDGDVVPMPCPAEYNFFFTHDLLLTDLGAARFDTERVRRDLTYLLKRSRDSVLVHAYYWKDSSYATELCTPDNWNHAWFVIVSASYLRHSLDTLLGGKLYPLLTKSIHELLRQKKDDDLIYAFRPDWWDIGRWEGPRSYMTILMVRALRDYIVTSVLLKRNQQKLPAYEALAQRMQDALVQKLWDDQAGYLLNYNGSEKDCHYYMGSLLAVVFDLLNAEQSKRLVRTAERELVDPRIGVRTVAPTDFNTDSLRTRFQFEGNEAGDPYTYINGGVWPHANAWFSVALQSVGRDSESLAFLRSVMTVEGVARSPMGVPAMYEYRFADPASSAYGSIDKPSFMWAGGMYLFALYDLFGVKEDSWNISIGGSAHTPFDSTEFTFAFRGLHTFRSRGVRAGAGGFTSRAEDIPSVILPLDLGKGQTWEIRKNSIGRPYLQELNAVLHSVRFNSAKHRLTMTVESFPGHLTIARVHSPGTSSRVLLDGRVLTDVRSTPSPGGGRLTEIRFNGADRVQSLEIIY